MADRLPPVSTSTPPKFAPEQEALYREVLELMNRHKVPYVVSGAFALQYHTGICRDTKDLDLFLPLENVPSALKYLQDDSFVCEVCDPVWLAKAHRNGFFVDLISGMSNAVITVDDSWIERGSAAEILGVPTKVLAAEELLASKLFVMFRERYDGADIAHIIFGTAGKLDWDRLLQLVGEHWEVLLLGMILFHYVYPTSAEFIPRPVWDIMLGRLRSSLDRPDSVDFRGSLVDDKMFAIDVKEWGMRDLLQENRDRRTAEASAAQPEETQKPAA